MTSLFNAKMSFRRERSVQQYRQRVREDTRTRRHLLLKTDIQTWFKSYHVVLNLLNIVLGIFKLQGNCCCCSIITFVLLLFVFMHFIVVSLRFFCNFHTYCLRVISIQMVTQLEFAPTEIIQNECIRNILRPPAQARLNPMSD